MTRAKSYLLRKKALILFAFFHISLAIALGPTYVFAPDEHGYLYTLNNPFGGSGDSNPQLQSGWISTSKPFLWIAYLPAKIMI